MKCHFYGTEATNMGLILVRMRIAFDWVFPPFLLFSDMNSTICLVKVNLRPMERALLQNCLVMGK